MRGRSGVEYSYVRHTPRAGAGWRGRRDRDEMRIIFCGECGEYSLESATKCDICDSSLDEDGWAEVSDDDLIQLDYIDDMEYDSGLPVWEYEVVRLNPSSDALNYNAELLNRMGELGWELVAVESHDDSPGARYGVFKRCWFPELD